MHRRHLLAAAAASLALAGGAGAFVPVAFAQSRSFDAWLRDFRAEARRRGISEATLRVLDGLRANQRVIEQDRRQPEFTITWDDYIGRRLSDTRISRGRALLAENDTLLADVTRVSGVPGRFIVALWGLETSYGSFTGNFSIVESLATLAWEGRRAAYFRAELLAALRILEEGHIAPAQFKGSWAGAMGQTQFMPTSFFRFAVDHDGDGRRDIWASRADVLASIANYIGRSGWRADESWGREVLLPQGFDADLAGHRALRPVADWVRLGVRELSGAVPQGPEAEAAVILPAGIAGPAFLVHRNFIVFRRWNPSNFFALSVGLLADRLAPAG
ncbi:MAG: lytic murein transglycosylase [Alphaproteobacteria bacterium]|nr:lytic murein transglycosylase [Alphaproteobacteria bacterium]